MTIGLGLALTFAAAIVGQPAPSGRPPGSSAAPAPASRASGPRAPASFDTVSASAAAAREAGRLDDAIALYRQGIALRADWDEGRWYLGSSLYERERYGEARDAFAALVARQPAHAGAVGMKGLCEFGLGQHETALRTLLQARSLGIARTPEIAHVVAYHAGILLTR
ncbi:MAG: tetratricopeptide repeat protein, partial [Vicinamibacteria bacterium]